MDPIEQVFDYFPIASLGAAIFVFCLAASSRRENAKFAGASASVGEITALTEASPRSPRQFYPTVRYSWGGESRTFESTLAIAEGKVGHRIDIEVAADGTARLKSRMNKSWEMILLGATLIFLCAGIYGLFA